MRTNQASEGAVREFRRALLQVERIKSRVGATDRANLKAEHALQFLKTLRGDVDRTTIVNALRDGLFILSAHQALSSEWFRDRDAAVRKVERSVAQLKAILRRWGVETDSNVEALEKAIAWTRERPIITIEHGITRQPGVAAGRPISAWSVHTETSLQRAGVSVRSRKELLRVVGLTVPRMDKQSELIAP